MKKTLRVKIAEMLKAQFDQDTDYQEDAIAICALVVGEIRGMKFRKVKGGWRQKGEIGTATNCEVVEAENIAFSAVIERINL